MSGPSVGDRLRHVPRLPRWSVAPPGVGARTLHNYRIVQRDAIAVGFASAVGPFLGVYLARFGATPFQLGFIAALPSIAGLVLAIPLGQFLLRRTSIPRWLGTSRMLAHAMYGVTGFLPFFVPASAVVPLALLVFALASVPQLMIPIAFNVVMSAVAGPNGRFELLSRRWSIAVLTSAVTVAVAGRVLDILPFPLNYQVVLIVLSTAGPISLVLMNRLRMPERELPPPARPVRPVRSRARDFIGLIRGQPAFLSFVVRLLPFTLGTRMALPLIPLFYVTTLNATDGEIGLIATVSSFALLAGYLGWTRLWRQRGGRVILLICGAGLAFYPAGLAVSREMVLILPVTAVASVFQAGLQLVLFDELMRRVPVAYSPTFVAVEQNLAHVAGLGGPLLGAALAAVVGLPIALGLAATVSLVGYGLMAVDRGPARPSPVPLVVT